MATLQIESDMPAITPAQNLVGWHRELCVELLGAGHARIFVRSVEQSSMKAAELARAILFHRLDPRFSDVAACVESIRVDLERLVDGARRTSPSADNLFSAVAYDSALWERVRSGIDRWARRAHGPRGQ